MNRNHENLCIVIYKQSNPISLFLFLQCKARTQSILYYRCFWEVIVSVPLCLHMLKAWKLQGAIDLLKGIRIPDIKCFKALNIFQNQHPDLPSAWKPKATSCQSTGQQWEEWFLIAAQKLGHRLLESLSPGIPCQYIFIAQLFLDIKEGSAE